MSVLKYSMMLNSFIGGYITSENQIPFYSFTSSSWFYFPPLCDTIQQIQQLNKQNTM